MERYQDHKLRSVTRREYSQHLHFMYREVERSIVDVIDVEQIVWWSVTHVYIFLIHSLKDRCLLV